jgi:DnaJ-class molecular chaperone
MLQSPTSYLDLPPIFTKEQLQQAYRKAVKKHHPDKGGDPMTFDLVVKAYRLLQAQDQTKSFQPNSPLGTLLDIHL